jgi:uncharacterized protein YdeI (YjbR/CyaY-like superfamily)
MDEPANLSIVSFTSAGEWEEWLAENHTLSRGIWIKYAKKDSGIASLTHDEAIRVALCYGWIDGQADKFDDKHWLVKFTPRGPKSMWSKRNRDLVAQLTANGRMQPAGLEKVKAAKKDGRWERAYDSPKNMQVPEDFLAELAKDKKAMAFFKTLNRANTYAIAWRLQTAKKPETREKRKKKMLEMMARGEKLHG